MSCEYSQLVDFQKQLDGEISNKLEKCMKEATLELAQYTISQAVQNTPVYSPKEINGKKYHAYEKGNKRVGGELRKHWYNDNRSIKVEHVGNRYVAEVVNNAEYASFVEEGHKQNVGQRFPVFIDGELKYPKHKKSFVKGNHALRKAENKTNTKANSILNKHIKDFTV